MILNYLPAGSGDQLPPIPDEAYFTYETYNEKIDGVVQTFSRLLTCNFTSFTGQSITMPNTIGGHHIKQYDVRALFETARMGNVTKVYFTNTNYNFRNVTTMVENRIIFPSPIEEVYMAYFNPSYVLGSNSSITIATNNPLFKKFDVQNKNSISSIRRGVFSGTGDFANCSNLDYNPFPFASICQGSGFNGSNIRSGNLDNFVLLQDDCFENCRLLTNVTFNGVTNIQGADTFRDCINLETIELKNAITINSPGCFRGCSKLKDVYFDNLQNLYFTNYTTQSNSPFYNCDSLEHIYTNAENVDNLKNIFGLCTYEKYGSNLVSLVTAIPEE